MSVYKPITDLRRSPECKAGISVVQSLRRAREIAQGINHGRAKSPEYRTWRSMKKRCSLQSDPSYAYYGARGITVCDQWAQSFLRFLSDVGERPEGTSLDRIDVNGNYEPGNVRWASASEQQRNRRDNHRVEFRGEMLTISEISEKTGIGTSCIAHRVRSGASGEILSDPPRNIQGRFTI